MVGVWATIALPGARPRIKYGAGSRIEYGAGPRIKYGAGSRIEYGAGSSTKQYATLTARRLDTGLLRSGRTDNRKALAAYTINLITIRLKGYH